MSISVHFNGKPLNKISSGVQQHQERFSENEGRKVLENTESHIDITQTKYNKLLFKSDELDGRSVKKFVSDELKVVNEKRVNELGKRKYRKDANSIAIGTFQISDDSLEKIGFDKSKKWEEQPEHVQNKVHSVYYFMVENAIKKPDLYGKVLTATLHVDEGTPHVDFMTSGIDKDRPDWSLSEVLNGKSTKVWNDKKQSYVRKNPPKGAKLSLIQDDLDSVFDFNPEKKKAYHLVRGEKKSEKIDFARKTRKATKDLKRKERALNDRESRLNEREDKISNIEKEWLIKAQRASESLLDEAQKKADEIIRKAIEKAERLANQVQSVHDKNVIDYMKRTWSKNVQGKTLYQVVDNNRMRDEVDGLMREMGLSGPGKQKQKQREFGD